MSMRSMVNVFGILAMFLSQNDTTVKAEIEVM